MNVLFISPGFPTEMPLFARALATVGQRVFGLGEQPESMLPTAVREALSGYLQVGRLWDEEQMVEEVGRFAMRVPLDREGQLDANGGAGLVPPPHRRYIR